MSGYISLLRPRNCLMAVLSVLVVSFVAIGFDLETIPRVEITAACLVVLLFTGAGNTLNDYLDRENDRLNHPGRPIPSGKVKPRTAAVLSALLFAVAVLLGFWLSLYCMLVILLNLGIMLGYEFWGKAKGLIGNIMISWLTASLFLFGGLAVLETHPAVLEPVWYMLTLSFFATLGREIAKDIQDMVGDAGRITLPMRMGPKKAGYAASISFLLAIAFSPFPAIFGTFGFLYLVAVLLSDAIFIYAAFILPRNPGTSSESAKLAMVAALVAFVLGVI